VLGSDVRCDPEAKVAEDVERNGLGIELAEARRVDPGVGAVAELVKEDVKIHDGPKVRPFDVVTDKVCLTA
jgi:hypothetical protein